ncbi:hypothetical protein D3C71_608950 [compost metagenome]
MHERPHWQVCSRSESNFAIGICGTRGHRRHAPAHQRCRAGPGQPSPRHTRSLHPGHRLGAGEPYQAAHRFLLGGSDRHHQRRGIPQPGRHRCAGPVAGAGALLQRQHHSNRRRRQPGAPGQPARAATGQHAAAGQRQTLPSRGGDHLPRPRPVRRCAGPGPVGVPVAGAGAGGRAARRRCGAIRLGRDRRGDQLRPEEAARRGQRGSVRRPELPGRRFDHPVLGADRPAAHRAGLCHPHRRVAQGR